MILYFSNKQSMEVGASGSKRISAIIRVARGATNGDTVTVITHHLNTMAQIVLDQMKLAWFVPNKGLANQVSLNSRNSSDMLF